MDEMDLDNTIYFPDTPDRPLSSKSSGDHSRNSDSRLRSLNQMENHNNVTKQGGGNRVLKFKIPRKSRTDNLDHCDKPIIDLSSSPSPSHSHRTLKFRRTTLETPVREKVEDRFLKTESMDYRNGTFRTCGYSSKGKEKAFENSVIPLEAGVPHVVNRWNRNSEPSPSRAEINVAPKPQDTMYNSFHMNESPKRGTKRFVRNGLISPRNIAKGKMIADQSISLRDSEQNNEGSEVHINSRPSTDNSDFYVEGMTCGVRKGKGVKSHLQMLNVADTGAQNMYDRETVIPTEDTALRDANEEVGNWRSTRSYQRSTGCPLSHSTRNSTVGLGSIQNGEKTICGSSSQNKRSELGGEYRRNEVPVVSLNGHARVIPQRTSYMASESSRGAKRYRNADSSNTQERMNRGLPRVLTGGPSSSCLNDSGSSTSDNVEVRDRQLEADERLARELQEQLYEVDNLLSVSEMDANIALALQGEQAEQASVNGTFPVLNPRASVTPRTQRASVAPRMQRQPRLRSSLAASGRRGARSRVTGLSRGAQPRAGVRVSSSLNFTGHFPRDMTVATRLDILEALEAASDHDFGVLDTLFQAGRDFDENDYERLLALDENNHEQGASTHQINILPLSTVQTDNFEDNCAICLETPGIGETIRHLPCFHKFHNECIDQWLGRKSWCPVCKSSVTQS
ncbi:unnamed protein product [Rhodiola kirilowii]